jgi:hypothetical protein
MGSRACLGALCAQRERHRSHAKVRSFTVRMDADNIKNAILVVGSDVTPFAKKVHSAPAGGGQARQRAAM